MKEHDIRPKDLFGKYLHFCEQDAIRISKNRFVEVECPGCGVNKQKTQFEKHGFQYVLCKNCGTLYNSPRPKEEVLRKIQSKGEAATFWSDVFLQEVTEKRRTILYRKKAENIKNLLSKKGLMPQKICDVGAGHGFLIETLREVLPHCDYYAIEPNKKSAKQCRLKGITTIESTIEKIYSFVNQFDMIICTELIEHVHSPFKLFQKLHEMLKPDGICVTTGLGYEGFDILTLQEQSQSVAPPLHINFLSINGFERLFKRIGFSGVEVFTPGLLDLEIVMNSSIISEFVRIIKKRGYKSQQLFQNFLIDNKMSSHVWAIGVKS